ncbi:MAG: 30S ribosomal protein S2, partial [Candidatus Woesearchaeota archaeon]|nr:30S ribosomal protein S2 [Candidatus Woesearchaeota archaeon]
YKAREDGLHVLDLKKTNERLALAASLISKYPLEKFYVVGSKDNAKKAVQKFAELTGSVALSARFTPGRFTNPARTDFCEPKLVMVVDPAVDKQSVREAFEINTPVIALCDTNNNTKYIDLVIPTNNKGRKSIALIFWILAREVLKLQGKISLNEEYTVELSDFEA